MAPLESENAEEVEKAEDALRDQGGLVPRPPRPPGDEAPSRASRQVAQRLARGKPKIQSKPFAHRKSTWILVAGFVAVAIGGSLAIKPVPLPEGHPAAEGAAPIVFQAAPDAGGLPEGDTTWEGLSEEARQVWKLRKNPSALLSVGGAGPVSAAAAILSGSKPLRGQARDVLRGLAESGEGTPSGLRLLAELEEDTEARMKAALAAVNAGPSEAASWLALGKAAMANGDRNMALIATEISEALAKESRLKNEAVLNNVASDLLGGTPNDSLLAVDGGDLSAESTKSIAYTFLRILQPNGRTRDIDPYRAELNARVGESKVKEFLEGPIMARLSEFWASLQEERNFVAQFNRDLANTKKPSSGDAGIDDPASPANTPSAE